MFLANVWSRVKVLLPSAGKVPSRQQLLCGWVVLGLVVGGVSRAQSQFMYFGEYGSGEIRRANLDGSGPVTLLSGLGHVVGPVLDLAGGQMYWAEEGAGEIRRANLDGSGQNTLVSGLPSDPDFPSFTPPVLDLTHGQMYWADNSNSGPGDIRRANLDGSEQTILLTGLNEPRGLTLDPTGGQLYWAEGGASARIWRANLDGSGVTTLLQVVDGPFAVALDIAGGKIYFASIGGDIQRANLDGSGQEILVRNPNPAGIALDLAGGMMYWANLDGDIRRANLDGSGEEILIKGLSVPAFIALDLGAPGTAAYFTVAAPASASAGTPFDITVTALDPYGNPAVDYQGTVTFTTSDTDPGIVLPADYTFTAADAGVHSFTGGETLITSGDQTITATDTASGMTRTVTVTVVAPE